jgi:hypothetical protein
MYTLLSELCRHSLPLFTAPVIRIVDNALPPGVEKIPNELFTTVQNVLAQFDGLGAFLPYRFGGVWREHMVVCAKKTPV